MLDLEAIRHNYLVYGLTDDQLARVAVHASERTLSEGDVLCREGDPGGELYIVLEGKLCVVTADGEILAEIGTNSVVGEMGLIDTRPRSATVKAASHVRVAVIVSSLLREEMIEDGNLGFLILCNINRVMSERLRHADAKLNQLLETAAAGA